MDQLIENEFEIDELSYMFKKWVQENNSETCYKSGNINENDIIKIIKHFFPNVEIEENKYILNISCNLWDKTADISYYLQKFKEHCSETRKKSVDEESILLSFDEVYDYYCNKIKESKSKCYVVNKRFFEKYLFIALNGFIEYERFISPSWYY